MIKVLTIGFEKSDFPPITGYMVLAHHTPGPALGMSAQEYYLKCKSMAKDATVLIVKIPGRNFSEDEVILIDTAYTIGTPIFCVGTTGMDGILQSTITNWFTAIEDALDHIQAYY